MSNTHFILDEMASIGHMECLIDAVDKFRAFGVKLQIYLQNLEQAKLCFPDGQEETLLANTTQTYFAVNNLAVAERVSTQLGASTIVVASGGTSMGTTRQSSQTAPQQSSVSHSYTDNDNWQQQSRPLLRPEEVLTLNPRTAITFVQGMPPICTTLLRYYEEDLECREQGPVRRTAAGILTLVGSVLFCAGVLGFAVALTNFAINRMTP